MILTFILPEINNAGKINIVPALIPVNKNFKSIYYRMCWDFPAKFVSANLTILSLTYAKILLNCHLKEIYFHQKAAKHSPYRPPAAVL